MDERHQRIMAIKVQSPPLIKVTFDFLKLVVDNWFKTA